jgi:hypothetical protein
MSNLETLDFEAMSLLELRDFWGKWHVTTRKKAALFIGDRSDARKIMEELACYSINKACAVALRLEGSIEKAQIYEEACQLSYERLPKDVQW